MEKWKYACLYSSEGDGPRKWRLGTGEEYEGRHGDAEENEVLGWMGRQGWELVAADKVNGDSGSKDRFIFKRRMGNE